MTLLDSAKLERMSDIRDAGSDWTRYASALLGAILRLPAMAQHATVRYCTYVRTGSSVRDYRAPASSPRRTPRRILATQNSTSREGDGCDSRSAIKFARASYCMMCLGRSGGESGIPPRIANPLVKATTECSCLALLAGSP
jgi:hypothetical protein